MIGTKLAHYEITSHLGSGGMGDVYQATDSKLGRSVAIKFLPEAFSHDTERVARFQREARVLAALNHSNIAAIHGVEEVDNRHFLVMELVSGETLADRIKRGAIPIEEALPIGKQIAEALEEAHEKGIVHRDLKPANIKLTPDGKVKVLDFGLAKAYESGSTNPALSDSPTISMAATNTGVILGTAAYMSPEQARGKNVDRRADVWAFGCVLYELLTGKSAFAGEDVSETLAFVMTKEPDWNAVPKHTPSRLRELLRRCLIREPRLRLRDIGEARLVFDDIIGNPEADPANTELIARSGSPSRRRWSLVPAALAGAVLASAIMMWAPWRTAPPSALLRLSAELGADVTLAASVPANSALALSPDGSTLAFVGVREGNTQIYVRRLAQLQASPLAGTIGAASPFFSPDGQWLAFFADRKLKKISVTGGAAIILGDATRLGGSWGDDGYIVFAGVGGGLQRVSADGGKAEAVTTPSERETHRWPHVLPGSKAVLYLSQTTDTGFDDANILVQPLPAGTPKVLVRGGYHAEYVRSGHLVYIHDKTLFAAPFDLNRLELAGQAAPAVEGVSVQAPTGAAQFAISETGALTYAAGQSTDSDRPVVWMTHDGKTAPLRTMPSNWAMPRFSPDGQKLALAIFSGNTDVWIYEWARDTLTRLTSDPSEESNPVWTPDGKRIVFASRRAKGPRNLYWQRADGTGEVQRLTESSNDQSPSSFHPNGRYLAFSETTQNLNRLMILPIEGDEALGWKPGEPSVFQNTPGVLPVFSPDGRFIAYWVNESGRNEAFVRSFPGPGGKWQVSTAGGIEVAWSRTRRELFYKTLDQRIMVVPYTIEGDSFKADRPSLWSEQAILPRPGGHAFDLHPDGERLAAAVPATPAEQMPDKIVFIFNFFDELRRIAPPTKK